MTIDVGNSLTKATLFEDGKVKEKVAFENASFSDFVALSEKWTPFDVIFSSTGVVSGIDPEKLPVGDEAKILMLENGLDLPVNFDAYKSATLGKDRIAAACGAAAFYPGESVLIVDAGTALTIDILLDGKNFLGGNISPGLKMRFMDLNSHTAALPLLNEKGNIPVWGDDTETAVRAGVVNGLIYEIYLSAQIARKEFNCAKIILTGGNAEFIAGRLEKLIDQFKFEKLSEIECQPDLVALGLLNIYYLNEKD